MHVHVHALVPGGGPSLDGQRWVTSRHPTDPRYKKKYLANVEELGTQFRKAFAEGLKDLHRRGTIQYVPPPLPDEQDPRRVGYQETFEEWADRIGGPTWNVYIQPPPKNSTPKDVLKYLARYMSGGPISNGRLISHEAGKVTFWARGKNTKSRPFELPGVEFVRRWAMHIMPKHYIRSRPYGGYSYTKRDEYLDLCRKLRPQPDTPSDTPPAAPPAETAKQEEPAEKTKTCPHCETPMDVIFLGEKPSWRDVFADETKLPEWYNRLTSFRRLPRVRGPTG